MAEVFDAQALREIVVRSLSELGADLAAFAPKLLGVVALLLLGWVAARVVQAVATGLLRRAGLDSAADRLGVSDSLRRAGISRPPSGVLARLFYWLVLLTFVLSAVETLGLTAVTATIDRLIAYLPSLIAAALLVVVGLLFARFSGNLVASGAAAAQLPYARQLGAAVRGVLSIAVAILAIGELGVDASLLLWALITLLAAASVGLALSFALGSRDVMSAILAGYYLRKSLREGGTISCEGREGVLERVGPIDSLFRRDSRSWSIPNAVLLKTTLDRGEDPEGDAP